MNTSRAPRFGVTRDRWRGSRHHVKPPRRDHPHAESQITRIDEVYAHQLAALLDGQRRPFVLRRWRRLLRIPCRALAPALLPLLTLGVLLRSLILFFSLLLESVVRFSRQEFGVPLQSFRRRFKGSSACALRIRPAPVMFRRVSPAQDRDVTSAWSRIGRTKRRQRSLERGGAHRRVRRGRPHRCTGRSWRERWRRCRSAA